MEKSITVTKVALSGGMFLKPSYKEALPGNDERVHNNVSCSAPVHEDLAAAFKLFVPHLALICEQISNEDFINSIPEEYDSTVGYSESSEMGEMVSKALKANAKKIKAKSGGLNGADEKEVLPTDKYDISDVEFKYSHGIESITLIGQKQLTTLDWMGIKSPAIKINGDYKYTEDLFRLGELLKYETQEYIVNHKYAPPVDPELPFDQFGDGNGIDNEQY